MTTVTASTESASTAKHVSHWIGGQPWTGTAERVPFSLHLDPKFVLPRFQQFLRAYGRG